MTVPFGWSIPVADSMIERMARAMCLSGRDADDIGGGAHPMGAWLDHGEPWWTGYCDAARSVLTAMREPTEAMERAGYGNSKGDPDNIGFVDNPDPITAYQAMIDAALEEGLDHARPGDAALEPDNLDRLQKISSRPITWGSKREDGR
jgi:hypothetical protein